MKKVLIAAAALVSAAPAYAQGVAPAGPFTGIRVEGRVGWDRPVISVDDESEGKSGVTYGGEAGFDFDLGNLVAGAYAGIEGSSVKSCTEVLGRDEACLRAGRNFTVGGRIGTRVGERALIYGKGGYSNGRLRATYEDQTNAANNFRASDNLDGFHLGAGVEALFGQNLYGKVEYVYTNYSTGDYDDGNVALDADLERHQVVAALGVRF